MKLNQQLNAMKNTVYSFRTKVFRQAYELVKATGKSFSVCLAKAWALYRLKKAMAVGIVKFAFEKIDGTLRVAYGTLKDIDNLIKGNRPSSLKTFNYYDVEAEDFRCFRIENLITIY